MRQADERFYWLLVSPALILFGACGLYPFVHTVLLSLQSAGRFVGLGNYAQLLEESVVRQAIRNTGLFVIGSVTVELLIGFAAALFMHRPSRGQAPLRVVSFLPWALPVVVAGIAFKFMLNDMGGVVNSILVAVGVIDSPVAWLAEKKYAMGALILADSWKSFPIMGFLILAGLQQMPVQLLEAARIDGASGLTIFARIILPLLKRVLYVGLMIRCMQAVAYAFDMVYSLTKGGPSDSTQVLVSLAHKYSFRFMQFEQGAALAVLSLIAGLALGGAFLFLILREARE
jgi:multiple sugar transport system permease protein